MKTLLLRVVAVVVGLFVLAQLVPYGRDHANPPVTGEPAWDSPRTEALFARACADCHSHETEWPWYATLAPVSWLVAHDVEEGREHFNVSAWGTQAHNEGEEAAEMVETGEMPLAIYLPLHPEARLGEAERAALIAGLRATFGGGPGSSHDGPGSGHDGSGHDEPGSGHDEPGSGHD